MTGGPLNHGPSALHRAPRKGVSTGVRGRKAMANTSSITMAEIRVSLHGSIPEDVTEEVQRRVGTVLDHLRQPVLSARVRLVRHDEPAGARPGTAQANLGVNRHPRRAQGPGGTGGEAPGPLEGEPGHKAERGPTRGGERGAGERRGAPYCAPDLAKQHRSARGIVSAWSRQPLLRRRASSRCSPATHGMSRRTTERPRARARQSRLRGRFLPRVRQ